MFFFSPRNNGTDHEYVICRLVHAMRRKKSELFPMDKAREGRWGSRRQTIDEQKEKQRKSGKVLSIQCGFIQIEKSLFRFP